MNVALKDYGFLKAKKGDVGRETRERENAYSLRPNHPIRGRVDFFLLSTIFPRKEKSKTIPRRHESQTKGSVNSLSKVQRQRKGSHCQRKELQEREGGVTEKSALNPREKERHGMFSDLSFFCSQITIDPKLLFYMSVLLTLV